MGFQYIIGCYAIEGGNGYLWADSIRHRAMDSRASALHEFRNHTQIGHITDPKKRWQWLKRKYGLRVVRVDVTAHEATND